MLKAAVASVLLALCVGADAASLPLRNFNIDPEQTSVSGLSSGGFMAVQFSVAYSSIVRGAGIIAGGPYYCAMGSVDIATRKCTCTGLNIPFISPCEVAPGATDVAQLIAITERNAKEGSIDPTIKLARQRIWMFSGALDSIVPPPVMDDLYSYYRHYIDNANILYRKDVKAEHAMPTESFGNPCARLGSPYIGNCKVDAAGELLNWIYGGNLKPPGTGTPGGKMIEFDQGEFIDDRNPTAHGMAERGFVHVPPNCERPGGRRCRLHVAFHGCEQSFANVKDAFIHHAGYNRWADANDIVVLYPQTAPGPASNPKACWNWFDFDSDDPGYATKRGRQMRAVKGMIDRVAGQDAAAPESPPAPSCFTASNAEHVVAGRAYDWLFFARAKGSGRFMGPDNAFFVTTLKRTAPDFYVPGTCP